MIVNLRSATGRARAALVLVAAAALTACGSGEPPAPAAVAAPTVVRTPEAEPGGAPAAPQGRPLLTVTGRIAATNAGGALQVDRAELDRLGLLAMSVDDPWAKRRVALQGVYLRDLVDVARPDAAATTLHVQALDDYQVDLNLADVRDQGVFLATRTGAGADLPVEDGGPTRIVFSDDLATRVSPDLWIWNITTIDVR